MRGFQLVIDSGTGLGVYIFGVVLIGICFISIIYQGILRTRKQKAVRQPANSLNQSKSS